MSTIIALIISVIMGLLSAYFAKKRNRNPIRWFLIGATFGLIGVLILLILPAVGKPTNLTNQVETAPATIKEANSESVVPADSSPSFPIYKKRISSDKSIQWYYIDEKSNTIGPFIIDELRKEIIKKKLDISTYIWCEEYNDWTRINEFQNYGILIDQDLI